jgi:chromosome segregation ATPase
MNDEATACDGIDAEAGKKHRHCLGCYNADAARARIATLEADLAEARRKRDSLETYATEFQREAEAALAQLRADLAEALNERKAYASVATDLRADLARVTALREEGSRRLRESVDLVIRTADDLEEARRLLERVKATGRLSDMLDDVLLDDMDALLSRLKSTPGAKSDPAGAE